jgi:hypothetical protein
MNMGAIDVAEEVFFSKRKPDPSTAKKLAMLQARGERGQTTPADCIEMAELCLAHSVDLAASYWSVSRAKDHNQLISSDLLNKLTGKQRMNVVDEAFRMYAVRALGN